MRVPDNIPTTQTVFAQGALPYQQINATPEDFGGAAGRAVSGMGQTLEQAGQETSQTALMQAQYHNEQAAMSAGTAFQQSADDLANGNADKGVVGYNTLRGKAAIDQQGAYQTQLQQAYDQARSSLTNPAAQRMFDQFARWGLRSAMGRMGDHAAQQTVQYNYTEARGAVDVAQQAMVNGADDPQTWASGLAAVQEASLRSSKIMGLDGDAAEAKRQEDLSKPYVDRTLQLALRDPIAAQNFYRQNIGMVAANQRYGVERMLNETTATQYAATDGSTATARALGGSPSSATPQNYNADTVKPYTPERISQIVDEVKKPSPYDDIFKKVGAQYGIDPNELKMRAAAESDLRPGVTSSQGATGIAQITPDTARTLGVDPKDPQQSIEGMARLMVRAEGAAGGDMSKVDRAYYGGSPGAQGPNTSQYAANLGAVRHALYGPNGGAPLTADDIAARQGDVEAQARALADQRRPGDAAYADRVVAEAQKNWSRQLQQVRGRDYSNMTQVLDTVVKNNAQSVGELPPALQQTYAQLTPRDMLSVQEVFRQNQRAASGEYTPSDPKVFNDVQNRINLPAGDPNRITDPSQITPLIAHGLNFSDSQKLITEMGDLNSPAKNPFLKQVNSIKQTAQKMLTTSMSNVSIQHPEAAQEAAYRFGYALDQQIGAMQKAGKDPHSLFDPTSPDYALSPARVLSFMPTEAEIVARQAAGAPGGTKPTGSAPNPFGSPAGAPQRMPGESPEAYLVRVGIK
jgi:soluble lytic murein transglycosylase-like protein